MMMPISLSDAGMARSESGNNNTSIGGLNFGVTGNDQSKMVIVAAVAIVVFMLVSKARK